MKEFFNLLKHFNLKELFIAPTKNGFLQFFRYIFVGGIATIVDLGILFVLTEVAHLHFLFSAAISFVAGLFVNYFLSKLFVFKNSKAKVSQIIEFLGYSAIGIAGLFITELVMYLFTNQCQIHYMISKIFATAIVLIWNYLCRKYIIYQNQNS